MKRLSRRHFALFGLIAPALLTASVQAAPPAAPTPLQSVNPFVGTAEHGHTYPGATVPFGMVQLSPDTRTTGWDGSSGYHYTDNTIQGFSHTHLNGTGVGDLGDILLMPTVGDVTLETGKPGAGYTSRFSHSQEKASPGFYSVFLEDPKVAVELTATTRCGFHKYTFPASDRSNVVLDLVHGIGNSVYEANIKVENDTTISGYRKIHGWAGDRSIYFVMEFSKPFAGYGIEQDGSRLANGVNEGQGKNLKGYVQFKTKANETVLVRVGISGTGVEGARKNLQAEIPTWNFNTTKLAAEKQWNEALGSVQVTAADPAVRKTFYSNLYLSFLAPVMYNDVDKTYRGMDKQNKTGTFNNYTTFSLWDTFRAQQPLLTILQPNRVDDMVNSLVGEYQQTTFKSTPIWPLWGNETWCMIGYHAAPVIVDAYLKGFNKFDPETAYQALRTTAMGDRNGLSEYRKYGYVLSSGMGQKQSVSRTLEYAYDDWCIAQMAQKLGHTEDAKMFLARAANYRNVYDSNVGFMRGRKEDGSWRRPFNPNALAWADYTEANAWQYSWTVMQDVPGLVNIMGGDAKFTQKLDTMFSEKSAVLANIPDITGLIGQYAHGNEPVHHVAYLYNYAGMPYMSQQRIREVAALYNDTPAGQCGNNDCGQMSSWYVFSALGFYPVNPVGGEYVIGSPLVDKAVLTLDKSRYGGKTFTVIAEKNSAKNMYIQSATLNGKPLSRTWITHDEIVKGGTLKLVMGATPNKSWGTEVAARPLSGMPKGYQYAALPEPSSNKFVQLSLPIRVACGSDDPIGNFVPDPNMMDGQTNGERTNIDTTSVADAAPAGVYMTERYSSDFTHSFPVPADKTYTVRLHFSEIFDNQTGERIQDVSINGQKVLPNFDILATAGGTNKAVVKEFKNIKPDAKGNIAVRIQAAPNSPDQNAKINGIEILPQ